MCNLYSITTNQAAIIALFRVINRYVGNLPPMPGVFPDYPALVIRNTDTGRELAMSVSQPHHGEDHAADTVAMRVAAVMTPFASVGS